MKIAIIGLGLIGGSLARALYPHAHISAFDANEQTLDYAREQGFVHAAHANAVDAVEDADIVVLAVPISELDSVARIIAPALKPGTIVTDTASVKQAAVKSLSSLLPAHVSYVPAHPIAGSEKSGIKASDAELFVNALVVLTPEEKDLKTTSVANIKLLWERAGARIDYMPPDIHDLIYAYVSHLPHAIAYASGVSRLAKADPKLWTDICIANAESLKQAIADYLSFLTQIVGELSEGEISTEESKLSLPKARDAIIASCLIASVTLLQERLGVHPAQYAGNGFISLAAYSVEPEILMQASSVYAKELVPQLIAVSAQLNAMQQALQARDAKTLFALFSAEN